MDKLEFWIQITKIVLMAIGLMAFLFFATYYFLKVVQ